MELYGAPFLNHKKKLMIKLFKIIFLILLATSLAKAKSDFRDVGIGVNILDIPTEKYTNFICFNKTKIKSWSNYKKCNLTTGYYQLYYQYDDKYALNENYEGTQIAGHPVLIHLYINKLGKIDRIKINSDPKASMYYQKQAHLFWIRAYGKYGSKNWHCLNHKQENNHIKIGKAYLNKICKKIIDDKALSIKSELYKSKDNDKLNLISRFEFNLYSLEYKEK